MAQFTYNKLIRQNKAPRNAACIGVYDSQNRRIGEIPLGMLANTYGNPIYRVGLLSDIHVDTTDYNYASYLNTYPYSDEGAGDLRRALIWLRDVEDVDMVCAAGDLSQYGEDTEFAMTQTEVANEIPNIPFYTCTGNHDCYNSHSGASTFLTYTRRTIDSNAHNIVTSTAYQNSFYFLHPYTNSNNETVNDVYVFFSMYNYSASNAYLAADITWLGGVLETYKTNRVFIFTHLFFPEYAGNLGRVNGTGGIYPTGNWLSGSGLTSLMNLFSTYSNCFWFSGHSHWKWDLQRYQDNLNVARYGNSGAWSIHLPSLALPIDSDYTNITQQTETNRVEKPLESQGAVMDVYEDHIIIRGIDFNINTSQNGDTTQGYTGDAYVRYLPIAIYELHTGVNADDGEEIEIGTWEQGGWGSANGNEQESTTAIRSPYIQIDTNHRYFLTTVAPIGDQSNPDSIREVSLGCWSGELGNLTYLGRVTNQSCNTISSKIGSTSTSLNYFDRIYNEEDITDAIFACWPTTTYVRFKCYLMGEEGDTEDRDISVSHGERIFITSAATDEEPVIPEPVTSEYVTYSDFVANTSKPGGVLNNVAQDYGDTYKDYCCVTFSGTKQGFWVTSPTYDSTKGTNQTAVLQVSELHVYSGSYTTTGLMNQTEITLPSYVGFYNGSASPSYQLVSGYSPSTTETNSEGRVQFQTSSSYTGGTITILMKIKINFS